MLLFFGKSVKMVVPDNRIYSIVQSGKSISMFYEGGGFVGMEGKFIPKIEELKLYYNSEENALNVIRQFYNAAKKGENAFFFDGTNIEKTMINGREVKNKNEKTT